jgi:hypothetical protein
MHVAVLTNDKALWAIRPFAALFNRFWSKDQRVEVVGFSRPSFVMPANFSFASMGKENWPAERWTDQLIHYLEELAGDHLVLMLEDYWLKKYVDVACVEAMWRLAQELGDRLLRIDLTTDRSKRPMARFYEDWEGFNVISTPADSPYQMSYQAAIWHRKNLLDVLVSGETPWQSEIYGSERLKEREDLLVLGTRHEPVPYVPVLRKNKVGLQNYHKIHPVTRMRIKSLIPEEAWA